MSKSKLESEQNRVLNFLVWVDVAFNAADTCTDITWFNRNQTRQALKRLEEIVPKEHGPVLSSLWETDESNIHLVMKDVYLFSDTIRKIRYEQFREASELLTKHFLQDET